jgi:hypothetical protein
MMADREKVINALGRCESYGYCEDRNCPYYENTHCLELLRKDALILLKEQEQVAPRKVKRYIEYSDTAVNFIDTYDCGNCGAELPDNSQYCSACGRKVKWE